MDSATPTSTGTRYIPVPDWPSHHPWPTRAGLRHLIFEAETNGFAPCIRRIGRRILLDEAAVLDWIDRTGRGV